MLYDDDDGECNAYDFSFQVRTSEGVPPFFFPLQTLLNEIYRVTHHVVQNLPLT